MFLLSFLSKFLRISELQHLILHDGRFLLFLANFMIASAVITFVTFNFLGMRASYGRYAKFSTFSEFAIPARIGWFLQEIPSFILPTVAAFWQIKMHSLSLVNALILLMFAGHYFQRSFIYPFLIRGGKAIPVHLLLLGFIFCTWNGTIQGFYHAKYAVYHSDHFWTFGSLIGLPLFALGMFINIQSDQILRSLRASGEIGYKIPRGAMFEFVSSANFLVKLLNGSDTLFLPKLGLLGPLPCSPLRIQFHERRNTTDGTWRNSPITLKPEVQSSHFCINLFHFYSACTIVPINLGRFVAFLLLCPFN